eukprot:763583-Hanusia_phi.AAC.10
MITGGFLLLNVLVRTMASNVPIDPGFPGNTSPQQTKCMDELLASVQDQIRSPIGEKLVTKMGGKDYFLCRLLRARNWDVAASAKLCQEIVKYREQHNLDFILGKVIGDQPIQDAKDLSWRPEILDEGVKRVIPYIPCGRHGYTSIGQPIEIWRINKLRPSDILHKCSSEDIWQWWHFHLESGMKATLDGAARYNAPLKGAILVFDLKGFGARHLNTTCIRLLAQLFSIGQSKYPESLSRIFVLNAPTLFSGVWNSVKGVLNERTRKKVVMTNKGMHDELKALVPPDIMPDFLGGKCPCNIGERIASGGSTFTAVHIPARNTHKVVAKVPQGGYLGWEFFTEGKDIKFGVYYFQNDSYIDNSTPVSSGEVVRELSKSENKGDCVTETLTDLRGGTYVLLFDNTYSMMTSKELRCASVADS